MGGRPEGTSVGVGVGTNVGGAVGLYREVVPVQLAASSIKMAAIPINCMIIIDLDLISLSSEK